MAAVSTILLLVLPVLCIASPGDISPLFKACVSTCKSTGCASVISTEKASEHGACPLQMCGGQPDWSLGLFSWSCDVRTDTYYYVLMFSGQPGCCNMRTCTTCIAMGLCRDGHISALI